MDRVMLYRDQVRSKKSGVFALVAEPSAAA